MRYFELPSALLLAGYLSSVAAVTQDGHRVLRAATKRADLLKRNTRISQKFESEVVYIEEENGWDGGETFASSVKVGSKKPILSLEEIEHHLEDVLCGDGRMVLHFVDASSAQDARAACLGGHGGMGGLVITSHQSCNKDGERAVYKVDDITHTKEGVTLDLAVTESLWQDAFDNLDISFGHTQYDHIYRRHSDFLRARRKRQHETTLEIPTDTPKNVTDVNFDLANELLDTTFTAADFLTGLGDVSVPNIDLPIEIGCKNCSTRGQIILTQGAIKIDTKQIDVVPDIFEGGDDGKELNSVITGGYMDLAVTGMGARLEMFARPISSRSYEIALFPLPVLGFVIPGVGKAGASFEPKIAVEFEVDGNLEVDYGIDVAIPDDAGIKVELGDLTNTAITGIEKATLNALPFTSNVTDVDVRLSLAFTPTIPIGFEFSDKLSALVTVSLNLPRLDARLTTNADDQCSLLSGGNKTKPHNKKAPKNNDSTDLTSLTLVEANISVVVDVAADLTLPLLPPPFDTASTSAKIFSTNIPLKTSCIAPVQGALSITEMAPVATLAAKAELADIEHTTAQACTCTPVTTTVYAAPPVTTGFYGGWPPVETAPPGVPGGPSDPGEGPGYPPFTNERDGGTKVTTAVEMTPYYPGNPSDPVENPGYPPITNEQYGGPPATTAVEMTPYYPDAPTDPAEYPATPVETPTGGLETAPYYPTAPAAPPTGGYGYGYGPPPTNSTPCTNTQTLRITISTNTTQPPSPPPTFPSTPQSRNSSISSTPLSPPSTNDGYYHPFTTPTIEESKGFMAPPHTATISNAIVTGTGTAPSNPHNATKSIAVFTGAAIPGAVAPEFGWQMDVITVVMAGGLVLGMVLG